MVTVLTRWTGGVRVWLSEGGWKYEMAQNAVIALDGESEGGNRVIVSCGRLRKA